MKRTWKFIRGLLIVIVTVVLTTIAINATDNLGNFSDSLIGGVLGVGENSLCPEHMIHIPSESGGYCIDMYENSPGEGCEYSFPNNQSETRANLEDTSCTGVSKEGGSPWVNIARHQAELACSNAGKRLPTNKEWYQASLGTPDARGNVDRGDCNVQSDSIGTAGSHERCVSSSGAYDMIGNVWEWVDETVSDGELSGRALPEEGYVVGIDNNGVPIETNFGEPDLNFNEDYLWVEKGGVRGIIRGGYHGNGTDAGQYTMNAITPPSFAGVGVGFRCAK